MAKEILVAQIGSDDRPAGDVDIKDFEKKMKKALKVSGDKDTIVFATHHAINMFKLSSLYSENTNASVILQLFDKGIIDGPEAKRRLGL